jgi:hypothetical protein
VCTPGSPLAQVDGVGGIDNAWGSMILPLTKDAFFTQQALTSFTRNAILSGQSTTLLRVVGLDGLDDTATGLAATASMGTTITSTVFDSTTIWPSVTNTNVTFSSVYIVDGTVVATGADGALPIFVWYSLVRPVTIFVHHPVITFQRPSASSVVNGVIAGTLDADELIETFRELASLLSQSFCSGPGFDNIASQIRDATDIMSDESNAPGKPCDAISIGLGFTARVVANDSTTVDASTATNPCATDTGTE